MLDIKKIRTDAEEIILKLKVKNQDMAETVQEILKIDEERRKLSCEHDEKKNLQKKANQKIALAKKEGANIQEVLQEMQKISQEVQKLHEKVQALSARQTQLLLSVPNLPHTSVPNGKTDQDNEEVFRFGKPRIFSFEAKPHWEIGADLGILDAKRAAKVTGARFHFYKGLGAKLERALINFFLDTHTAHGYQEILPPYMVNRASMIGTGQLPKFEEDAFLIANNDFFLIPTAEVPVTNYYRDEILSEEQLPISFCAYSACFRAEAGSAGRDVKGLIRQHQFNKVELVKFVKPEDSYRELEKLTEDARRILEELGLAYRVVNLCGGDLGFSSAKTYDIEVWMPSYGTYKEISSCSNFEDYQARRAGIRFKDVKEGKNRYVHTLNGSGVAVGRTVAAILENYQNEDGSVTVPKVLQKYMSCDTITKE